MGYCLGYRAWGTGEARPSPALIAQASRSTSRLRSSCWPLTHSLRGTTTGTPGALDVMVGATATGLARAVVVPQQRELEQLRAVMDERWEHTLTEDRALAPATSARDRAHPLPHLPRDWAPPLPRLHGTGLARCHICTGTGLTAARWSARRGPVLGRASDAQHGGGDARDGRVEEVHQHMRRRRVAGASVRCDVCDVSPCAPMHTQTPAPTSHARPFRGVAGALA